jgi:hypothetical protein
MGDWGKRTPRTRNTFADMNEYAKYDYDPNAFMFQTPESMGMMKSAAEGLTPSIAEAQLARGLSSARSAAASAGAGARGSNLGLGLRTAIQAGGQASGEAAGQAAMLRAQELAQARNAYNQSAMEAARLNQVGGMQYQQLMGQDQLARLGIANNMAVAREQSGIGNALIGGGLNAAGAIGASLAAPAPAASDKNLKTDVKDGKAAVQDFLDAISAKNYTYKKPFDDGKKHTSVMAQDLEKTSMGKQMVKNTPAGKMVDYGQGFAAIVAAQAELNDRLKRLEKRG